MSDDRTKKGGADRQRIDVSEDYECRHWSEKFGASPDELKRAVQKVAAGQLGSRKPGRRAPARKAGALHFGSNRAVTLSTD